MVADNIFFNITNNQSWNNIPISIYLMQPFARLIQIELYLSIIDIPPTKVSLKFSINISFYWSCASVIVDKQATPIYYDSFSMFGIRASPDARHWTTLLWATIVDNLNLTSYILHFAITRSCHNFLNVPKEDPNPNKFNSISFSPLLRYKHLMPPWSLWNYLFTPIIQLWMHRNKDLDRVPINSIGPSFLLQHRCNNIELKKYVFPSLQPKFQW